MRVDEGVGVPGVGERVTVVGSTTVVGGSGVELYTVEPGASTTTVECAVTVSCSVTGTLTVTGTCSVMVTGMTVVMVWMAVLTRVMLLRWLVGGLGERMCGRGGGVLTCRSW